MVTIRSLLCICLVLLTSGFACSAERRPLTLEDLLDTEQIQRVVMTPDGRYVIFEKTPQYREAPNLATHASSTDRSALAHLYVFDTAAGGEPRPLFAQRRDSGYWLGGLAPDAKRLAIYSLEDERLRAGVFDLTTRRVLWFAFTPSYYWLVQHAIWLSNDELVFPAIPETEVPAILGHPGLARKVNELWQQAFSGNAVSATSFASTSTPADRVWRDGALLKVNANTGEYTRLAVGHFYNIRIAPQARYLAAVRESAVPEVFGSTRGWSSRPFRQLVVVDLNSGVLNVPCESCDVELGFVVWLGDGARLLFYALHDDTRQLNAYEPRSLAHSVIARPTFRELSFFPEMTSASADSIPVGQNAAAVYRLEKGQLWRVDVQDGTRMRLTVGSDLRPWSLPLFPGDERAFTGQEIPREQTILSNRRSIVLLDPRRGTTRVIPRINDAQSQLVSLSRDGAAAVYWRDTDSGQQLILARKRSQIPLIRINQYLAKVLPVPQRIVSYTFAQQSLSSCLLLPPQQRRDEPLPVIVFVYPDFSGSCLRDGRSSVLSYDYRLFTSAGYAVLFASTPKTIIASPEGPTRHLTPAVLAALNAAAATGLVDSKRAGAWGFSQGHHAVLQLISETNQFKAAIALHGLSNLASAYGQSSIARYWTLDALQIGDIARFESQTSATAMGMPPWMDPARYIANSPAFAAHKIDTPVLLVSSDLDSFPMSQADEMFTALYRLRRNAEYVIYWGEGHGVLSPANLQDIWSRMIKLYDQHLT